MSKFHSLQMKQVQKCHHNKFKYFYIEKSCLPIDIFTQIEYNIDNI